jgi:hypothetical protein
MRRAKPNRGHPHPIRFDKADDARLKELAEGMNIPKSDVVRMAVRFALPKFLSGEVSIKDLAGTEAA